MKKAIIKTASTILSIYSLAVVNTEAISPETENLTIESKKLSVKVKENEEVAKKELEKALENYLASVRLLNIDDTKLTVEYRNDFNSNSKWETVQYATRIRRDISAIHTHVQNTYQTHVNLYNKNVPPQEVKK